jgi:dolichol-phosphate mannosyltransferase
MRVAVVLPMYDEAENIAPLLARLADVRAASGLDLIAIAIDDGSRDATSVRLAEARTPYPFLRCVSHPKNRGLAATLRTGIATALAERQPPVEAIACMDADLTHAPEDLLRLVEPLQQDRADFVLGSRYVPGGGMRDVPWVRRAISVLGNRVGRRLLGVPASDLTSGYRMARAEVYRAIRLEEPGFGIQLEGTVKAHRAGFRVAEVPITLGVRRKGYSKMAYTRAFWIGYARLFVRLVLGLGTHEGRLEVAEPPPEART